MVLNTIELSQRLTLTYMTLPELNAQWLAEFQACFAGYPDLIVKANDGIAGDVQTARLRSFEGISTPYVFAPDSDDTFDMMAILNCVQYLEDNPDVGACGVLEKYIREDGRVCGVQPKRRVFLPQFVYNSPTALHNAVVFRTSVLQNLLTRFAASTHNYFMFDWALRIMLVNGFPYYQLPVVGYTYRGHDQGHRVSPIPVDYVQPQDTIRQLLADGLINLTDDERRALRLE